MSLKPYVSLITLGVEDLDRALAFYRDGLGWPVSGAGGEDVAFLRTGGVVLSLYLRGKLAEDARIDRTAPVSGA